MDVLLTHGYFLEEDEHERRIMKPYPPLGILSISSHLKACGYDVRVFDSTFQSPQTFVDMLAQERPAVVGLYCTLMTKLRVLEMIQHCRGVGAKVVAGGPEPANYAEEFLNAGADVVVVGEGERTMEELLPLLRAGRDDLHTVAGAFVSGSDQSQEASECLTRYSATTVAYPIKGTPYYRQVEDRLIARKDWSERTERDWIVRGRHSRRYYQYVTRWMVGSVALNQRRHASTRRPLTIVKPMVNAVVGRIGMALTAAEVEG